MSFHPRRTAVGRCRDDVTLVVTVAVQTISIDRDLHVDPCPGCVTNRDLPWWHSRTRNGGRDGDATRTSTRGSRDDVALVVTVAIQTTAINRDFHEESSRRCVANRNPASLGGIRRRRSHRRRRSRQGRSGRHCIDSKLTQRVRTTICRSGDDVVNVVSVTVQTTAIDVDLHEGSCRRCMADRDLARRHRRAWDLCCRR